MRAVSNPAADQVSQSRSSFEEEGRREVELVYVFHNPSSPRRSDLSDPVCHLNMSVIGWRINVRLTAHSMQ